MVTLEPNTPERVGTEVTNTEADHTMATPLPDVDLFMTKKHRRVLAAFAHDDDRTKGDPIGSLWHRPTDPQAISIAAFKRHVGTVVATTRTVGAARVKT